MSKKMCTSALRAVCVCFLAAGFVAGQIFCAPPVLAQRGRAASRGRVQRWEYCAVSNVSEVSKVEARPSFNFVGSVEVCYLQNEGCRKLTVEGTTKEAALAKAIARLGDEGWEMVSESPFTLGANGVNWLFFKRPRP